MSRSKRSRLRDDDHDDEDKKEMKLMLSIVEANDMEEEEEEEEEEEKMGSTCGSKHSMTIHDSGNGEMVQDGEVDDDDCKMFSSQAPEMSQNILNVKDHERSKLMEMSESQREKAISNLSRFVLFKALAGETIDRAKACKEAGIHDARISSAAFEEVQIRLQCCFDFEIKRMPVWMEKIKAFPKCMKDRYYVVNTLEDATERHSKALHAVHEQCAIEKGLLMVILSLIYCKGQSRNDGSRWINDKHLYELLHRLDENLPPEPMVAGSKRSKDHNTQHPLSASRYVGRQGVAMTPDVDTLLNKFCHRDYLFKEKATTDSAQTADADEETYLYTMGPRAIIEIGRRQIIYFCAEILDEDVETFMLEELEQNADEEYGATQ